MNFGAALRKDMFQRQDTEDMIVATVSKDGMLLQHVKNKTQRVIYTALQQNWRALRYVDIIDNFLARQIVLWDPKAASLLPPQHHLTAVIANIDSFNYITKPSMEACRYLIRQNPDWIAKRPNPPMELCLLAVKIRHKNAQFLARCNLGYNSPYKYLGKNYFKGIEVTEALASASLLITKGTSFLSFPEALKTSLAAEALRLNLELIPYMTMTPVLQEVMLSLNGATIRTIENPTDAQKVLACRTTPHALKYVKNPPREAVLRAATCWGDALKYAAEQDEDLCVHAVRHFTVALKYVKRNRMGVWMQAGAPMQVILEDLFPQYRKSMTISHNTWVFFRQLAVSLHSNCSLQTTEELEDPLTLETVAKGTAVAFIEGHFAGTLSTILQLQETRFRGSNFTHIFIPIKNTLIPIHLLQWRMS